jgi:hypothetical protein
MTRFAAAALMLVSLGAPALAEEPVWRTEPGNEDTQPGSGGLPKPEVNYTCDTKDWARTWYTEYGTVTLGVVEDGIAGTFEYLNGNIAGRLDESGCVLTGRWDQDPSHKDPGDVGPFVFVLSRDGTTWTGHWSFDSKPDYVDTWNGALSQERVLNMLLQEQGGQLI